MRLIQTRSTLIPLPLDHRPGRSRDVSVIRPSHPLEEAARSQGDILLFPEEMHQSPLKRLVVLIPEGSLDDDALVSRVWRLASAFFLPVLFLGLSPDPDHLSFQRRQLAILTAKVTYGGVKAGSSVFVGINWQQAVKESLLPGDVLVCNSKFQVPYRIFGHALLGESLSKKFSLPVYMLEGLDAGLSPARFAKLKGIFVLLLSLATILAFAGFQIWIDQKDASWLSTLVICFSVVIEMFAILKVNEWIG